MVQMEVRDQQHVDLLRIDAVKKGEAGHTVISRVDATVEEEGGAAEGEEVTGSTNLLAGAEGGYCH